MKKTKNLIIIIMSILTLSTAYATICTNSATCRNHACCNETTNGAKPYFNGSVCTSIPQTYGTGSDCDYSGPRTGLKIGNMCISKTDKNASWCEVVGNIGWSGSSNCPKIDNGEIFCGGGAHVPTITELMQIAQIFYSNPSIRAKLDMTTSGDQYWSSSETSIAWLVRFYSGHFNRNSDTKTNTNKVRCVK